ncbi:hypothetical protein HA050_15450 [Iodobacter sp. HSC-16F04]|uniref:DUF4360 domain-containing protein n=1 Tax=Iodobacter violaceini TaxID=3044271 RepID=A0ABX0L4F3_9NEIS|nr:hypothetical protein [Iodobacter violacea]NHQ87513.1 hypothetical protein [Iodobacter violacea]
MKHPFKFTVILMCILSGPVMAKDIEISCDQDDSQNPRVLALAPSGAKRIKPHTLQVNWQAGKHLFKDKPPFDEPLSGRAWHYCTYNAQTRQHLILVEDEGMFSGELLNERTGKIIAAGKSVRVTNDLSLYFSIQQPSGFDGEEWKIFNAEGKVLWNGLSVAENNHSITAEYIEPRWSDNNQLQARHRCTINNPLSKTTTVTLEKVQNNYQWRPQIKCPRS